MAERQHGQNAASNQRQSRPPAARGALPLAHGGPLGSWAELRPAWAPLEPLLVPPLSLSEAPPNAPVPLLPRPGAGVLRHGFDSLIYKMINEELPRSGVQLLPGSQLAAVRRMDDGTLEAQLAPSGVSEISEISEVSEISEISEIPEGGGGGKGKSEGEGEGEGGQVLQGLDSIVVAAGRQPATRGLGLETTGVALDRSGRITVDGFQETHTNTEYPHKCKYKCLC